MKKVALVTGAAQGIGFAIARMLAENGNAVAIADLNADKASQAAQEITDRGLEAHAVEMNVADPDSIGAGVAAAVDALGEPTALINNAGIYRGGPTLDLNLSEWHMMLDVILTGPMLLAKAVVPYMRKAGYGRIINMGSLVSHTAFGEDLAYTVAKTGIIGFTRSLAAEFASDQICVNAICPGNIMTDLLKEGGRSFEKRDGLEENSWINQAHEAIPLGRIGDPDDVANVVRFLCSDESGYITGQTITVNGGMYYL